MKPVPPLDPSETEEELQESQELLGIFKRGTGKTGGQLLK